MSRGNKKKPKSAVQVSNIKSPQAFQYVPGKKTPVIAEEAPLYDDTKAAWRVSKIQIIDPYGFHELDAAGISKVKERLAALEGNTWSDIFIRDARHNHQIQINQLKCPIAKKWMADHFRDQPCLWTIRVTGIQRIWGILSEGAYQIVFWDPSHLIWEIPKK
jgi:hypothetical protein